MKIFGFFSLLIWAVLLIMVAITFDWLNARDHAQSALVFLGAGVEFLSFLGDELMEFFAEVQQTGEGVGMSEMPETPEMPEMPIEPKMPESLSS